MKHERGTAVVETALVVGLLLMLVIGAAEVGFAFRDSTIVTAASREAARIAGAIGEGVDSDPNDADCAILEAAAGALNDISDDQVLNVEIFRTDSSGVPGISNVYRPGQDTDDEDSLVCETWFPMSLGWPESGRDFSGDDRDWIGVEIVYDHDWHTGFFPWSGSVCDRGAEPAACWTQQTIMHMEPNQST